MLTRLKVSGFKNLVDVDVRFGPFTCIAGANGVGKSNLFDAIRFLSALANSKLIDAARSVRGADNWDIRGLFTQFGSEKFDEMSFEAEMIIPAEGVDDLGQKVEASITFVRYKLRLAYNSAEQHVSKGGMVIQEETLEYIPGTAAKAHLLFPHDEKWRESVIVGVQRAKLISTIQEDGYAVIQLHQNRKSSERKDHGRGKPASYFAANLPKTVLSEVNTADHRTALLARREMESWHLLQLEPSAMRVPDQLVTPPGLDEQGTHLPATLYHLARRRAKETNDPGEEERVYAEVTNRLSDLLGDIQRVTVDRDERRQLLTLYVHGKGNVAYPARSLSDGTLRFLALTILESDTSRGGVLCLEEPENGIHPERITAMIRLLRSLAVDTEVAVGRDNPLRQIIFNTHSPVVAKGVGEDTLLFVTLSYRRNGTDYFRLPSFHGLSGTWRDTEDNHAVSLGTVLTFLNPSVTDEEVAPLEEITHKNNGYKQRSQAPRRVMDRDDVKAYFQLSLFGDDVPK